MRKLQSTDTEAIPQTRTIHKRGGIREWLFNKNNNTSLPKVTPNPERLILSTSTDAALSEADALVLQAVSQPSVLTACANDELNGEIRQRSASLFRRLRWTLIQSKVFNEAITELGVCNNNIRHLIVIKSWADPTFLLQARNQSQNNANLDKAQALLQRLNKAILSVNKEPRPDYLEVNIRLVNRHEVTRSLWNDQGLEFRPEANVVQLQARRPGDGEQSCFLLVDAPPKGEVCGTPGAWPTKGASIDSLKDNIVPQADPGCENNFKLVGHIPSQAANEGSYVIYQDVSASWTIRSSLAVDLQNSRYKDRAYAAGHISLAALAALPYVQCVKERLTTPYPRPQHFQFYDYADAPDSLDEELVVPYVSAGFGSRTPRPLTRTAGRFAPIDHSICVPGIELGLLLFQIGSWTPLEYHEGHRALEKMRNEALGSIDEVVKHSGLGFAKIVELCLQLKKDNHEEDLYSMVVAKLQELDEEMR